MALAAPARLYILVFLAFPLLYNLWLSATDASGANLIAGNLSFNRFENYGSIVEDPAFWRSVTLSGMGFGFDQMMSERSHQPSARRANATIQGTPMRSFGLRPGGHAPLRGA